jgi:DivIVA domain-containing protein
LTLALDRQDIEKRDFPIERRGYDPEAVDAHLAALASEFEALQRASRRQPSASLAQAASEQVRAIVEAAESTAADIERSAEQEAAQIRTEAQREAERTRSEAVDQARERVGQVTEATSTMMGRVDSMEQELGTLVDALRTGANRLNADLALLEGNLGDLYRAAGAGRPAATGLDDDPPEAVSAPVSVPVEDALPQTPELDSFDEPDVEAPTARGAARGGDGDVEGARLIALNMALNGQSRAETDRYLAENFDLADRAGLLDEVYASVEG